jgi:hypothetical protein
MNVITQLQNIVLLVLHIFLLAVQGWALVDCVIRRGPAFAATGKLTKPAWLGITGFALLLEALVPPSAIVGGITTLIVLCGVVASLVYLTDVRPAVREVSGPSRW